MTLILAGTLVGFGLSAMADSVAGSTLELQQNNAIGFKLTDAQVASRYRLITDREGNETKNQLQQGVKIGARIRSAEERVRFDILAGTGSSFDSGWDNSGLGTGDADINFNVRRLFLTVKPSEFLGASVGSMPLAYGFGSEDITFDKDGYVMGYRLMSDLFGTEIVLTAGSINLDEPSVFRRFDELDEFNYIQAMIARPVTDSLGIAAEATRFNDENYLRGAIEVKTAGVTGIVDKILIEDMVRVSGADGNAFAFSAAKKLNDLIGDRDLNVALSYIVRDGFEEFPVGDYDFQGQSIRAKLTVPNLVKMGPADMAMYAKYIQSITDADQLRAEGGVSVSF